MARPFVIRFRIRFVRRDEAVHTRWFTKQTPESPWTNCGVLIIGHAEWTSLRRSLTSERFEFREESRP